jgi:ribose 5-phosphate isomerase B
MKIFIGADHNGYKYKNHLMQMLKMSGHDVVDEGDYEFDKADDFPHYSRKVVTQLLASKDKQAKGILICGSGQGMCMAANRYRGIRASICWNLKEARAARNDDDSNVLCLSASQQTPEEIVAIVNTWLATPFAGAARFKRRIKELDEFTN